MHAWRRSRTPPAAANAASIPGRSQTPHSRPQSIPDASFPRSVSRFVAGEDSSNVQFPAQGKERDGTPCHSSSRCSRTANYSYFFSIRLFSAARCVPCRHKRLPHLQLCLWIGGVLGLVTTVERLQCLRQRRKCPKTKMSRSRRRERGGWRGAGAS